MKYIILALIIISEASFARDFCQANNYASTLWNRNRVQDEVHAAASEIKNDIFSAYMASYIPMTFERDKERCGGTLASDSVKQDLIGDHLADIMSKFHVKYTLSCIKNPSWNTNSSSFCADYRRVRQDNLNSLSAMLIASSTYLSSHMATSLSALILDDKFWTSYPGHTISDSKPAEMESRMKEIRKYKKLYDKNNPFLAQSLSTVIASLEKGCYVNSKTMNIASLLAEKLNLGEYVFKIIRDETFEIALTLAAKIAPRRHPMLSKEGANNYYYVDFEKLSYWDIEPLSLRKHKRNTSLLVHPPGFSFITRNLGGIEQSEFNLNAECRLTNPRYVNR